MDHDCYNIRMICKHNIRITWLHYKGIYMYVYSFWKNTKLYHMCVYIACIYIYGYWALYQ